MTIEQLLGHTAQQLIEMDDTTLRNHLEPFFKYTRPERLDLLAPSKSKLKPDGMVEHKVKKPNAKDEILALLQMSGQKLPKI